MENLTDAERKRLRVAGKVARGLRYVLYLAILFVLLLLGAGIYISVTT